ncbi:MAG TPA: chemotaxis protein CheA [Clostridiaceae bacterium]|nr:chemotaxis protein CheA [Clostridiaceae bacterium]
MDTSQYMEIFLEDSIENLHYLNDSLLHLEKDPGNKERINEIFRAAHTIKGMAATMGFGKMTALTHKMEDVLSEFREGHLEVTQEVITLLFKCLDTLESMANSIKAGSSDDYPIDSLIKELELISFKEPAAYAGNADEMGLNEYELSIIQQAEGSGLNVFQIKVIISETTLLKAARAFLVVQTLEESGDIIKSVPAAQEIEKGNFDTSISLVYLTSKDAGFIRNVITKISEIDEAVVSPVSSKSESLKAKPAAEHFAEVHRKQQPSVRVDLNKLDMFMNRVSELVICRTRLEQIGCFDGTGELDDTLEMIARATTDLQELVMKIRMLPIGVILSRFPRMVRDLSVELSKDIELQIKGNETELDRVLIDEIGEPLIHILRNAADHGIESRMERTSQGKNPTGRISITAYQEGTSAVIRIEDDGRGMSLEQIKTKAAEKAIDTSFMSDSEIMNLIFMQGFSTSDVITDISGRGVGMDVVKTKISDMGGTLDVFTEKGKGTAITIKLPLTLQIIKSLLVMAGNETMAISLGYIDRVIDYKDNIIKKTNSLEVITYKEMVIPLVRLDKRLGLQDSGSIKKYIIIVSAGEKTAGLVVDSLLGQKEIVIKPLGKTLQVLKEYIGATILGDGRVILILDVAALI